MSIDLLLDYLGVRYREVGGNQSVLCPFHEDKVSSASVCIDKDVFHCFTCGAEGGPMTLLIEQKGMSYADSKSLLESLAREAGREVPRGSSQGRGDSLLPRKSGHRPGRRAWVSPWGRNRP